MLLVDDIRDHDVANRAVERGGLPEQVDAAKAADTDGDLAEDVVGAKAEWIVDVDDDRRAPGQAIPGRITEARVKVAGRQSIQDDDLGRDIQACLTRKKEDAALLLFAGSIGSPPARIGRLAIV